MSKSEDKDQQKSIVNRGVVGVYRSTTQIFFANLVGGMAWGLGAVIGATLIVTVVLILLDSLGGVPFIGSFFHKLALSITEGPGTPNQ